jgi:predicted transcriptional regulator
MSKHNKIMNLQDSIINLLSFESELTAKQIFGKISKENSISYQAIHKMLSEMEEKQILTKNNKAYSLNLNWVAKQKQFYEKIIDAQKKNTFNPNLKVQTLELNTLFEFFSGMLDLMSSDILYHDCNHRFGGGILRHLWWSLSFDDIGYAKFKHMLGPKDSYIVAIKDTPVDKWLKTYYEKTGATGVKIGVDYDLEDDIAIVGHYVIQIFFDTETKKMIDKLYSKVKDISDAIEKGILEKVLSESTNIRVVITHDKQFADIYLRKLVSFFGNPDEILNNPKY